MTDSQFAALRGTKLPTRVILGVDDPQMSHSGTTATAQRIGAPAPIYVPGRHLTMISAPRQVAAAIQVFIESADGAGA
jgi:pimeloyl-ACP methyl ester carboxylesterase